MATATNKVVMKKLTIGGKTLNKFVDEIKIKKVEKEKNNNSIIGNISLTEFLTRYKDRCMDASSRQNTVHKLSEVLDKEKFFNMYRNPLSQSVSEKIYENGLIFINSNSSIKVIFDEAKNIKIPFLKKWNTSQLGLRYYLNNEYITISSSCDIPLTELEVDNPYDYKASINLIAALNMESDNQGKLYSVFMKTPSAPYIQISSGFLNLDQEVPNVILNSTMKKILSKTSKYPSIDLEKMIADINKKYLKNKYAYSSNFLNAIYGRFQEQTTGRGAVVNALSFNELKLTFEACHAYTEKLLKEHV